MKGLYVEADWTPREGYKTAQREVETQRALRGNNIWRNVKASIVERPMPQIAQNEVLIKVGACGVCGSDVHALEMDDSQYTLFSGHSKFPIILGHEFAGEVVEIGSNVKNFKVGDLVAVEEMQWCGECMPCRIGMFNQCQALEEPGLTIDGGFTEYAKAKEKFCCSLNDIAERLGDKQTTMEAGALVEPTCVAYNGIFISAGGIHVGGHAAVFGTGPIGLAAISLVKAAGAGKIIAFDTTEPRRKLAKDVGADYVFDPIELAKQGSSSSEAIMEITKGIGASTLIEASGNTQAVYPEIEKALAINSKTVQLGMDSRRGSIDMVAFQLKRGHIHGSIGHAGDNIYPSVIQLMASGRIDMLKMVTARIPLSNAMDAIHLAEQRGEGKILVSQYY